MVGLAPGVVAEPGGTVVPGLRARDPVSVPEGPVTELPEPVPVVPLLEPLPEPEPDPWASTTEAPAVIIAANVMPKIILCIA